MLDKKEIEKEERSKTLWVLFAAENFEDLIFDQQKGERKHRRQK